MSTREAIDQVYNLNKSPEQLQREYEANEKIRTGGEAFWRGMSLRDWFAGLAMQSLIKLGTGLSADEIAGEAYICADAMLKRKAK